MRSQQIGLWAAIGVLLVGIFLIDMQMALGFTPWQLYVIPLGLTYWATLLYAPFFVAAISTILMLVGFDLSPPLVPESVAMTNRLIGAITFWGMASLIVAYKLLAIRLSQLTEQLRLELNERTQDLGRVVIALRAEEGREQGLAPEGEDSLEKTRTDLEHLGRQLEQLQRDLLR
ncbi:MAG TPA: hypothetical protein VLD60_11580 [Nitrospira sp.]|nr:hypothetical protein [Nitrospira sp.]